MTRSGQTCKQESIPGRATVIFDGRVQAVVVVAAVVVRIGLLKSDPSRQLS